MRYRNFEIRAKVLNLSMKAWERRKIHFGDSNIITTSPDKFVKILGEKPCGLSALFNKEEIEFFRIIYKEL